MNLHITQFQESDTEAVVALWHACGLTRPWNDPYRDVARKLLVQPELFLLVRDGNPVVASIMAGFDGHRGWVNYLAVTATHRGQGLGRALMREVEQRLEAAGCPKLSLMVRKDNHAVLDFYTHLGYGVDDVVAMGKRLIHDLPVDGGS